MSSVTELKAKFISGGGQNFDHFLTFISQKTTKQDRQYLLELSQEHDEEEWKKYREGRVTASIAHMIRSFTPARHTPAHTPSVALTILGASSFRGNQATEYGKRHEAVARAMYQENPGSFHKTPESVQVKLCGMCLDVDNPLISASPDGLVNCKCCGLGLIEIKCMYKHRNENVLEIPSLDASVPFVTHKGQIFLKKNSKWYDQIIVQLGVTRRDYCDLVVYSEKGIAVTRCFPNEKRYKYHCQKGMMIHKYYVYPDM